MNGFQAVVALPKEIQESCIEYTKQAPESAIDNLESNSDNQELTSDNQESTSDNPESNSDNPESISNNPESTSDIRQWGSKIYCQESGIH